IRIENNILLKIDTSVTPDKFGPANYVDNKILSCAYSINEKNKKKKTTTILVSKDINLKIRARAFGIQAQDYEKDKMPISELYDGFKNINNEDLGKTLLKKETIDTNVNPELKEMFPNECIHFENEDGDGIAIGRKIGDKIVLIKNKRPWGLNLRNKEQAFAADLLCDPKLPLVTLVGRSGSGKTLCAVASALEMVLEQKKFSRMIIYRPIQPVGNDIGFLPGLLSEKLEPWMQAVSDSFEFLFEAKNGTRWKTTLDRYIEDGTIQMEAITYIRGRSIPNAFILLDESQNISKSEVKTILTRVGIGTKIILTGDIEQIDNSYLDATNNGLAYVVEKFKDSDLAGHITFAKGERSQLATKASEIL
ncbi:MAG TPA: PhoH family protein, partial [Paenisporosarcina sp.]|nr:PhoH family protein [Paenisporosarcina sp.]